MIAWLLGTLVVLILVSRIQNSPHRIDLAAGG
ncbi:hypothetical protein V1291_004363 [Nitrobacteraceae bacterium AZCC 1564]